MQALGVCSLLVRRTRNERIGIQGISWSPLFDAKLGLQRICAKAVSLCYKKTIMANLVWHEA